MKKRLRACVSLLLVAVLPACQQQMAKQPSYNRPLQPSDFFEHGRSARPIPAGTVARGRPLDDAPLVRYLKSERTRTPPVVGAVGGSGIVAVTERPARPDEYVNAFPFPITKEDLKRGQLRFDIYCALCHGSAGTGGGRIVQRGYLRPPSYHTDNSRGFERRGIKISLRDAPVGYFYEVISQGFGTMPDYAEQIPPTDRWKIIAYVRALQLSQGARLDELPEDVRAKALKAIEGKP
jgi:mono/diheme cytochrome c family protein